MPKLYLHVGTAKTGSTSLQYFLAENERRLRERGFTYFCDPDKSYYGWDRLSTHSAHFPIVASFFKETPDFISTEKHLAKEHLLNDIALDLSTETRNVILSAEHFSSRLLSPEDQFELKRSFGRFDVKVIFYLRPQHEMLVALHDTGVMCGKRENIFFIPSDYAPNTSQALNNRGEDDYSMIDIDCHSPFLNYWECLQPWLDVFGEENIIVRDYKSLVSDDIRIDFLGVLGINNLDDFAFSERMNESHTLLQIETLRKINRHLPAFGMTDHADYFAGNKLREIILGSIPRGGVGLGRLLSASDRRNVMSMFSTSNSNIERRFFHSHLSLRSWDDFPDQFDRVAIDEVVTCQTFFETIVTLSKLICSSQDESGGQAQDISGHIDAKCRARATLLKPRKETLLDSLSKSLKLLQR